MSADADATAEALLAAHHAKETFTRIGPPGADLAFAYAVQARYVALLSAERGAPVAGYKIGLTTAKMQAMVGLDQPIAGSVLADRIHHGPTTFAAARYGRLGIECEIALRIGRPHDGPGDAASRDSAAAMIDGAAAAFEVIDDRNADYGALEVVSLVADNSWNEGLVLGPVQPLPDLAGLEGVLRVNGGIVDRGRSDDVLGHPLNAIAWLVRFLAARGDALRPGQWVTTGSIIATRFPGAGDRYAFSVGNLPAAELTVA